MKYMECEGDGMANVLIEENGAYGIDCSNAVWASE